MLKTKQDLATKSSKRVFPIFFKIPPSSLPPSLAPYLFPLLPSTRQWDGL